MTPPKRDSGDAAGMRAISSFFAPKTNIVTPTIASPGKEKQQTKALKVTASDAPGSNARLAENSPTADVTKVATHASPQPAGRSPAPPGTASAKKSTVTSREVRRRSSDFTGAEAKPPPASPTCSTNDIGRRVAVFWPSEKKFYPARVAAVDTTRGKHHLRYDDGDDEWINLSRRTTKWDEDADLIASENLQDDDDMVSEKSEQDDSDDADDADAKPTQMKRVRVTAKGVAVAAALEKVKSKREPKKRRAVVLSDSDSDFTGASGSDASESEFEVESEESEEDEDSEEESESECSDAPAKRKSTSGVKGGKGSVSAKKPSVSPSPAPCVAPAQLPAAGAPRTLGSSKTFAERMELGGSGTQNGVTATPGSDTGDLTSGLAGPARYADRENRLFPWLHVSRRKDLSGRRPSDAGYDPSTLQLPPSFPKCVDARQKPFTVSPGQAQWWRFKSQDFDSVILFKMGKFYELFEMDAHVGASDLGLAYMKGEQPHCGFPEKNYAANAERLARAGHRVVVVEQVETPAQLAERRAAGKTKDSVVAREKVGILTKGTLVDVGMCEASPDASYVVSLVEIDGTAAGGNSSYEDSSDSPWIGMCAADCATGRFLVGAWRDDATLGGARAALAALKPVELVAPPQGFSPAVQAAARDITPDAAIRRRRGDENIDTAARVLSLFEKREYFSKGNSVDGVASPNKSPMKKGSKGNGDSVSNLPPALLSFANDSNTQKRYCALGAFGAMTQYLADAMLDEDLIPLGRVEKLPGPEDAGKWTHGGFVHLDAAALQGLEILEDSGGGVQGSLLQVLDKCASPGGRRLLRRWITRPLRSAAAVKARQLAVADLRGVGIDAMGKARLVLKKAPDLERVVSRLVGVSGGRGRDAQNVVLYEDAQRERLKGFLHALEGMKAAQGMTRAFDEIRGRLQSPALRLLVTQNGEGADSVDALDALDAMDVDDNSASPSIAPADLASVGGVSMPSLDEELGFFQSAFDWETAKANGRIAPKPGADLAVDAADDRLSAADEALQKWLQDARQLLGGSRDSATFASANKDTHLVEVPDRLASRVPGSWSREGKRKGFERFDSPDLQVLRQERADAEEAREIALADVLRTLTKSFCDEWPRWRRAAETCAVLDALSSLAVAGEELAATCADTCTPTVVESTPDTTPFLKAERMRHPCLASLAVGDAFVPNDVTLGGVVEGGADNSTQTPPLVLLTGPNMGGKSTLLRQVCLSAVMAHIGADVPAKSFSMSGIDAVYVRMGARDDVAGGRSTFMVELSETATMLRRCTAQSLIALDELGRGTSTSDGFAIASAVVDKIIKVGARTLFATHYHRLAEEHEGDEEIENNSNQKVALAHMGLTVSGNTQDSELQASEGNSNDSPMEQVTFLYTLERGSCPKSYGVNVARLAGLPESVLAAASKRSAALEANSIAKRTRNETARVASGTIAAIKVEYGTDLHAAWTQAKIIVTAIK